MFMDKYGKQPEKGWKTRCKVNIIPAPYSVALTTGKLKLKTFSLSAEHYEDDLARLGAKIRLDDAFTVNGIGAKTDSQAYSLCVTPDGIEIKARSQQGVFYAYTTLFQMLVNYGFDLPCCKIDDAPRFPYRGFMLDTGRYFMPADNVKKLVLLCALHKINKFHIHLTEDQGWRVEIKKYPLLTQKGSVRNGTNFSHVKHGGFYTREQLKDLGAYCKKFFIELIPETDMPGHSRAAIACYPHLGCFDRKLPVATHWGVKHDILCAGKESTYEFACDVLDEICDTFDGEYVHLGGDEAPKTRWKLCPHCQKKMQEEGLENEEQLQSYFINRLARHLQAKGKKVMMWNEFSPTGMTDKNIVRQFWSSPDENRQSVADELSKGINYVNSDAGSCYLDLPEKTVTLEKGYRFNPLIPGAENGALGMEACLWSEYVPDYEKAQKLALPRLCALAETMWTNLPDESKDYDGFLARLKPHVGFLANNGFKVADYSDSLANKTRKFFAWLWFNRRPLHWEGLHIALDNAAVKRKYGKKNKRASRDNDR